MNLRNALRDCWVGAQLALVLLILIGVPLLTRINLGPLDPILGMADPRGLRLLGGVAMLAAMVMLVWGVRSLGRNLTPTIQPVEGAVLVESGPYGRVRHPIYAGMILLLTGYTLAMSNWRLAIIVFCVTLTFFDAKASREEELMAQHFPGYAHYRRRVPKLLPWARP
jgi:protein-S-isoprenylcysteine O-methyltransferase Ste14